MAEYIKREDILKRLEEEACDCELIPLLLTPTAADVVEVVRCKECKYRQEPTVCPMCHEEFHFDEDDGGDYYIVDNTEDCGFCHAGERRDDNG